MMATILTGNHTELVSAPAAGLSRQHRAWVALYSLRGNFSSRQEVLAQNDVTEADLAAYVSGWLRLQEQYTLRRR
jgi:hypothetical protein